MSRFSTPFPPVTDSQLARAIAGWVRHAPRQVLLELADSEGRECAASALAELIAANMTMAYPELVDSSAPPLPF